MFYIERWNKFLSNSCQWGMDPNDPCWAQTHGAGSGKQLVLAGLPSMSFPPPRFLHWLQPPSLTCTFSVVEGCLWSSTPFLFPSPSYRNYCKINSLIPYFIQQSSNSGGLASGTRIKDLQNSKFIGKKSFKTILCWWKMSDQQPQSLSLCLFI